MQMLKFFLATLIPHDVDITPKNGFYLVRLVLGTSELDRISWAFCWTWFLYIQLLAGHLPGMNSTC